MEGSDRKVKKMQLKLIEKENIVIEERITNMILKKMTPRELQTHYAKVKLSS